MAFICGGTGLQEWSWRVRHDISCPFGLVLFDDDKDFLALQPQWRSFMVEESLTAFEETGRPNEGGGDLSRVGRKAGP